MGNLHPIKYIYILQWKATAVEMLRWSLSQQHRRLPCMHGVTYVARL